MSSSDLNPESHLIIDRLMDAKPALDPSFRDRLIYESGRASGRASSNRAAWTLSRLLAVTTVGLGILLWSNVNSRPLATNPQQIGRSDNQPFVPPASHQILRATEGWVSALTSNEDHPLPHTIGTPMNDDGSPILTPAQFYIDANSI